MGKKRIIAETAPAKRVATANVAALFGFKCDVFMARKMSPPAQESQRFSIDA